MVPESYCRNDNNVKTRENHAHDHNMPKTTVLTRERSRDILTHVT